MPQVQALFAVDPVHPLLIDAPTLASKQDVYPKVSVPNPCLSYLPDPYPQCSIILAVRTVPVGRTLERDRFARPPLAYPIRLLQVLHLLALLGWL